MPPQRLKEESHLFVQAVLLGGFVKPCEVDLEKEQVLPGAGMADAVFGQSRRLAEARTGQKEANPKLEKYGQLRADVRIHWGGGRNKDRRI